MKQASLLLVLVVSLAIGLGFVTGAFVLGPVGGLNADTDTHSYCDTGNTGYRGGGQFVDAGGDQNGELLSTDKVWLSWVSDGTGIPFSVAGKIHRCEGALYASSYGNRYVIYLNNGDGFRRVTQDDFPEGIIIPPNADTGLGIGGGWKGIDARQVSLDGTSVRFFGDSEDTKVADGAVLKVEVQLEYQYAFSPITWTTVAQDEAQLRYGIPKVTWGADLYEVGETWRVSWSGLPFLTDASGATAYYLTISNDDTKAAIGDWNRYALTATSGVATGAVTADMFRVGGANRLRAEIYSTVFQAGVTDTAVIDAKELAPTITAMTFNQPEFREGDTLTVTYAASPNAITQSPIARYHVLINIDGAVLYDQDTTQTSVATSLSRTGNVYAEVTAYDQAGRPSAVERRQATVGNVIDVCEVKPDLAQCQKGGGGDWVAIIGAAIVFVIGALIATRVKKPIPMALILFVFAGVAFAVYLALRGGL